MFFKLTSAQRFTRFTQSLWQNNVRNTATHRDDVEVPDSLTAFMIFGKEHKCRLEFLRKQPKQDKSCQKDLTSAIAQLSFALHLSNYWILHPSTS